MPGENANRGMNRTTPQLGAGETCRTIRRDSDMLCITVDAERRDGLITTIRLDLA